MEQAGRTRAHLERVLLICGLQSSGKSRLLRHMLGDLRLGSVVPAAGPFRARPLSKDRCLAGRFTSPHEMNESTADFHDKIDHACLSARPQFWRINYFSAVQPRSINKMPDIVDLCRDLMADFRPERIRVVQLCPDQWGNSPSQLTFREVDGLRKLDIEVVTIDARRSNHPAEPGNVRFLADYFDFS